MCRETLSFSPLMGSFKSKGMQLEFLEWVQLNIPEDGWLTRWPLQSRILLCREWRRLALKRLTQGGCSWIIRALPLYYLCPYLLENHEERQHEEHYCQQASACGLVPLGENRAVSEVFRTDAGLTFTLRPIPPLH